MGEKLTPQQILDLVGDLNEDAVVEDMTDYQSMIRRALLVETPSDVAALREEYKLEP